VALGGNQITGFFANGNAPGRYGNAHASLVPYQVFHTADDDIVVAVGNDIQWKRYCEAIDRPDLAADPRWSRVTGRVTGRGDLVPELERTMRDRSANEWVQRLEAKDVPCGRINNYAQVFDDPQVEHRRLRVDITRPEGGVTSTIASPLRLTGTPVRYDKAPPVLGDAVDEVLGGLLGRSAKEIEQYRTEGVI
jgi:crotonobetainyl-CoA:carnitine CoA-transferase CaiB-like acyl-CoA transferase